MSDQTNSEEVVVLKERHIAASKDHFLSTLLDLFDDETAKERFGEFASCIEALFYVNRIAKIEAFKQCYSVFSDRSELNPKHALSLKQLSDRQSTLMHMIYDIVSDAHFQAITYQMYNNATERVFASDLPIKVDYAKLDRNLWTEFYKQFPTQNPYATLHHKPQFHEHFSMFYRGYGLKSMKGLFIAPKINLILADVMAIAQEFAQTNMTQFIAFMNVTLFDEPVAKPTASDKTESKENEPNAPQDMITLQRISLLDTYNAAKAKGPEDVAWWFLSNTHIQEPTFKRLIVIYRQIRESFVAKQTRKLKQRAKSLRSKLKPHAKTQEEEVFHAHAKDNKDMTSHPIRIQYFRDIPMSDLEMIYPAKQFSLKPMDELYLIFTIFLGIWGILTQLVLSTGTVIGYWMVMICVMLMVRSFFWYRAIENDYVRVLNESLVESNISSDQDTILSLVDSVGDQQFMETILAYYAISRNNDQQVVTDSDGVDRLCERFMKESFDENVNLRIEGAMNKLSELGLFKSSGMSKKDPIKVKELSDALSCVHSHYKSAIQTLRKVTGHTYELEESKTAEESEICDTPPIISDKQISNDHFNDTQLVD
eukprot:511840_1